MRKINLKNYQWDQTEYKVVEVMTALLFNPELKLTARDLVTQDALARHIEVSFSESEKGKEFVLLEETDYLKVKKAVETLKGWQRGDLEFVNRVLNAETVDVKEA